jgi:hypothetical protein
MKTTPLLFDYGGNIDASFDDLGTAAITTRDLVLFKCHRWQRLCNKQWRIFDSPRSGYVSKPGLLQLWESRRQTANRNAVAPPFNRSSAGATALRLLFRENS